MNHKWHVHMKPFSDDATAPAGRCASMDGHFNPYHVDLKVRALHFIYWAKLSDDKATGYSCVLEATIYSRET